VGDGQQRDDSSESRGHEPRPDDGSKHRAHGARKSYEREGPDATEVRFFLPLMGLLSLGADQDPSGDGNRDRE
jgi:hypothetical protein